MILEISAVHWLVILGVILSLFGGFAYVKGTIQGVTKPNRVTWGMWALAPLIGSAIAISAHADPWTTIRIFLAGFIPLIIFVASFVNKQSYWKLTVFDILCGAWSLAAILAWLVADSPEVGILFAVLGDAFAALPTIRKAWLYPETENGVNFVTSLLSILLVLPSIPVWDITNAGFQIYLVIANSILIVAVYRKRILRALIGFTNRAAQT